MLTINTNKNINILTNTTFSRDEDGNIYCPCCAEEAREYGELSWEISDEDNPVECSGCDTILC